MIARLAFMGGSEGQESLFIAFFFFFLLCIRENQKQDPARLAVSTSIS